MRLKRYWSNIETEKKLQRIREASAAAKGEISTLNDVTWDIYGSICEYLDVQDMARMGQINKKFYELNKRDCYWENQYNRDWKNSKIPYGKDRTFKEKCIEGFKQTKRKGKTMTEEERDIMFGTYYILFEEMLKSVYNSPHLLLLPAKLIGLLALLDKNWTQERVIRHEGLAYVDLFGGEFPTANNAKFVIDCFNKEISLPTFKNLHRIAAQYFALWALKLFAEIPYFCSYPFYLWIKATTYGREATIRVQRNADLRVVKIVENTHLRSETDSFWKKFILMHIQFVGTLFFIALLLGYGFGPAAYLYFRYDWNLANCIAGPGLVFILHYILCFFTVATCIMLVHDIGIYYRPFNLIKVYASGVRAAATWWWNNIGQPVYMQLASWMRLLYRGVHYFIRGIIKGVKGLLNLIKKLGKGIFTGYIGLLSRLTIFSTQYGRIGDLLLTPFALLWMGWPAVYVYYSNLKAYYIPAGVATLILMIIGYRAITKATNLNRKKLN